MGMRRCCRAIYQNMITRDELQRMMQNFSVIIIDVRSTQEYNEGHFNGAINIPLCEIKRRIGNVTTDKNQVLVMYCDAGVRSMKAIKILNEMGYRKVYNFVYN